MSVTPQQKRPPDKDGPCSFVAKSLDALCSTSNKILIDGQIVELPKTYPMPQFSITPADFEQHLREVRQELCSGLQYCKDCQHYILTINSLVFGTGLCGFRLHETTAYSGIACTHFSPKH